MCTQVTWENTDSVWRGLGWGLRLCILTNSHGRRCCWSMDHTWILRSQEDTGGWRRHSRHHCVLASWASPAASHPLPAHSSPHPTRVHTFQQNGLLNAEQTMWFHTHELTSDSILLFLTSLLLANSNTRTSTQPQRPSLNASCHMMTWVPPWVSFLLVFFFSPYNRKLVPFGHHSSNFP